ncbi:hypothetical protein D3C72_2127990 [compost metagenome]
MVKQRTLGKVACKEEERSLQVATRVLAEQLLLPMPVKAQTLLFRIYPKKKSMQKR